MPRSAKVSVELVKEGNKIRMKFEDYDFAITFDENTGASGNKAYGKLIRILDVQRAMAKQAKEEE